MNFSSIFKNLFRRLSCGTDNIDIVSAKDFTLKQEMYKCFSTRMIVQNTEIFDHAPESPNDETKF